MIRTALLPVAATAALAVSTAADPRGPAGSPAARAGAAVMAYEHARANAIHRRDDRAYERLAAPDATVVTADGRLIDRQESLDEVRTGKILRRPDQTDELMPTRVFGDLALVSGRSSWHRADDSLAQEYFLRVWERSGREWRLVAAHDTAVPWRGLTNAPLVKPRTALDPAEPVVLRAVDPGVGSAGDVLHALHDQHRLYWERLTPEYSRYIGDDLLRIAERGVRTKGDLIGSIDDKLFRPMSPQVDERVHVAGNAAIALWRDGGVSDEGIPTQSWVTMVFAKRGSHWQIVQMHSTVIPPSRALPVPH